MRYSNKVVTQKKEQLNYHRTKMQKDMVISKLRERGCRITKQRLMLLDIILEEEFSCCKEIYYKAISIDDGIGTATVYRMINILEEIGAISRKNMYKIACGMETECNTKDACIIELDDHTICDLSGKSWIGVITAGLKACGYMKDQRIKSVTIQPCACE